MESGQSLQIEEDSDYYVTDPSEAQSDDRDSTSKDDTK